MFQNLAVLPAQPHIVWMQETPDQPSIEQFETSASEALARVPKEFREKLKGVALKIEEFADPEQLASVGIENRWELTGLYEGTPLTEQSVWDVAPAVPIITLFRQPLLLEMRETGADFDQLVRHVVIHEAGHHFGLSDDDMHALEEESAP